LSFAEVGKPPAKEGILSARSSTDSGYGWYRETNQQMGAGQVGAPVRLPFLGIGGSTMSGWFKGAGPDRGRKGKRLATASVRMQSEELSLNVRRLEAEFALWNASDATGQVVFSGRDDEMVSAIEQPRGENDILQVAEVTEVLSKVRPRL